MLISIVGSNCKNGMQLFKNVNKAIKDREENIKLIKEDADVSLKKHNIKNKPGLVINNKLISEGKVLNEREITRLLNAVSVT